MRGDNTSPAYKNSQTETQRKCRDEGNTDSKLDVELIPLALEATGAVGREVKEIVKDLKHAYETRVLPISNSSAAAAFSDA